ncbi:MAG: diguanylate cyclase [Bryobacterales bacterium]|nr:diguanylate cyclase [Bryobacterales bacterium]
MELGSLEVQIFVSLVVVLGTAFIALVCDFLKGNNEQLRERNVELRTRQDEREKLGLGQPMAWLQGLAALIQRGPAQAPPAPLKPEADAPVATPVAADSARPQPPIPEAKPVTWTPPEPVAPVQEATPEAPMRRRLYDEVRSTSSGNTWASKEELEQLAGRAARIRARHEAGQQPSVDLAQEPKFASPEPAVAAPQPPPLPSQVSPVIAAESAIPTNHKIHILPVSSVVEPEIPVDAEPEFEIASEVESAPEAVFTAEPVAEQLIEPLPERNYEFQQAAALAPPPADEPELVAEAEKVEPPRAESEAPPPISYPTVALPPGMQEPTVLTSLLEANQAFNGVAVSIGINDYEALRERLATAADSAEAMAPVHKLIDSMLRPEDFACRFNEDEFVLLFPGETGSSAQRRLFQVSEKLWDFQLRSLGQLAVMFSWGGLEVPNDSLSSAVSAARERMYQTRRNRRQSPLDRKRVVNA